MLKTFALVLLVVPLVALAVPADSVNGPAEHWRFAVMLDGKRIGEHDFQVTRHGDDAESFLTESRLLNSQTGEYESVNLTRYGVETLQVGGQSHAAQHYSLRTGHFGIDLWYSSQGEWLALESHLENGRTLRYEIEQ